MRSGDTGGCPLVAGAPSEVAAIVVGAALAGFVQGLSGFAYSLVAMSVWAWALPPQVAAPLTVFGALIGQFLSLASFRRGFELRILAPLIVGGALGVPIGVFILHNIDARGFKAVVGGALILYALVGLGAGAMPRVKGGGAGADAAAGLIGGVFGGLGGMSGAAPAAWAILRGWRAEARRAAMQAYNIAMHVLTLIIYWRTHALDLTPWTLYAIVAPTMLFPAFLGARAAARLSEAATKRVLFLLLFAAGVALILGAAGLAGKGR